MPRQPAKYLFVACPVCGAGPWKRCHDDYEQSETSIELGHRIQPIGDQVHQGRVAAWEDEQTPGPAPGPLSLF